MTPLPQRDEDEPADGHMDPDTRAAYRRLRERLFGLPLARQAFLQLLLGRARAAWTLLTPAERARSGAGETAYAFWRRELIPARDYLCGGFDDGFRHDLYEIIEGEQTIGTLIRVTRADTKPWIMGEGAPF